ncbi:MAG: hypothetical protein AAFV90_24230 [Cyanobacteria bacterium J06634_5]
MKAPTSRQSGIMDRLNCADIEESPITKFSTGKMSITFYDSALELLFRQYVAKHDTSNVAFMNALVELAFDVDPAFSDDVLENMREVVAFIGLLDWNELKKIREQLQSDPLTRSATLKDVAHGMNQKGIECHNSSFSS